MRILALSSAAALILAGSLAAQNSAVDETLDPNSSHILPYQAGTATGRSTSACDDFNRANGPLGGDWTNQVGTQEILNNVAVGTNFQGNAWTQHNSFSHPYDQTTVKFDLLPNAGSGLSYVAAVTGTGGSDNLFVKLQNQGSALYNWIGFYHGFNGGGWFGGSGFTSITPVTGGAITMYISNAGDTYNVDIDEDFNGTVDYHYETGGINNGVIGMGNGMGMGTYNNGTRDNWEANVCGPGVFTLSVSNLVAGSTATVTTTNGTASDLVGVAYSLTGGGPSSASAGPCGTITVDLSAPVQVLGVFTADAAGSMSTSAGVPAGTTGVSVWIQALDVASCTLSNGLAEVIG